MVGAVSVAHATVKVQLPVDTFELVYEDIWLRKDEFKVWMEADDTSVLPTDPWVKCDWGDGTVMPDMAFALTSTGFDSRKRHPFPQGHTYQSHGIYPVTCHLYNRVSAKNVTFNVSQNSPLYYLLVCNILCLACFFGESNF